MAGRLFCYRSQPDLLERIDPHLPRRLVIVVFIIRNIRRFAMIKPSSISSTMFIIAIAIMIMIILILRNCIPSIPRIHSTFPIPIRILVFIRLETPRHLILRRIKDLRVLSPPRILLLIHALLLSGYIHFSPDAASTVRGCIIRFVVVFVDEFVEALQAELDHFFGHGAAHDNLGILVCGCAFVLEVLGCKAGGCLGARDGMDGAWSGDRLRSVRARGRCRMRMIRRTWSSGHRNVRSRGLSTRRWLRRRWRYRKRYKSRKRFRRPSVQMRARRDIRRLPRTSSRGST